jgi:hypothetical protein
MASSFPIRLYRSSGAQRVAVVSVEPSTKHPGQQLVRVAKGPSRTALGEVQLLGPFRPEALEAAAQGVVAALVEQGYSAGGSTRLLEALGDASPRRRALAALNLAWRGEARAVAPLFALAQKGKQDVSTAVDALGLLEAKAALEVVRAEAERKLLSRRRAGAEALRRLGDDDASRQVRARALERLPASLRAALLLEDEALAAPAATLRLTQALESSPLAERGLALDSLYELGTPLTVAVVRGRLEAWAAAGAGEAHLTAPQLWRYVKSVWKRSMLRGDFETFGPLSVAIERLGRTSQGTKAALKSGLDGEVRDQLVFSPGTVRYLKGRAWRYLKRLATFQPDRYVDAAVAVLTAYRPEDDGLPKGAVGTTGRLYLLHRVLLGRSTRFTIDWRTLNHAFRDRKPSAAPADAREESSPELWDARPAAYVRLLGGARRDDVIAFGLAALRGRAAIGLSQASHRELVSLLDSPSSGVVGLGLEALVGRFDPEHVDWALLEQLAQHASERARALAVQWLERVRPQWTRDAALVVRFLTRVAPPVSAALAPLAVAALGEASPEARRAVALELLAFVRAPEPVAGAHWGPAQLLAEALLAEVAQALGLEGALSLLVSPSEAASELGARALGRLPGVLEVLGWGRLAAMASDERASVRAAALGVLAAQGPALAARPGLLFELVESDWDEVRAAALEVLGRFSAAELTFDGLVAVLDSPRVDVQERALGWLSGSFDAFDTQALLSRLAQHPHPNMRQHVLTLVERHLKPGFVQLAKVEPLLKAVLLEPARPSASLKRRTVAFLEARGHADAEQAALAARLLAEVVRTQTRSDRERFLGALVRLSLAYPALEVPGAPVLRGAP